MSQERTSPPKKSVRWSWIIAGLIVLVVSGGFALNAIQGSFTYYLTAAEFVHQQKDLVGRNLKVAGKVKLGSLSKKDNVYYFIVQFHGKEFPVNYAGLIPDTFKEGAEVVVEGHPLSDGSFQANTVMAKCASKYEAKGLPPLEQQQAH